MHDFTSLHTFAVISHGNNGWMDDCCSCSKRKQERVAEAV